jgi:hypothetical protein
VHKCNGCRDVRLRFRLAKLNLDLNPTAMKPLHTYAIIINIKYHHRYDFGGDVIHADLTYNFFIKF